MAADPKTASLYSRMQSYGTLIEAPRDVPDARFALPATVHWMRALAIATVDQKLNFAAGRGFYANVHARGVPDLGRASGPSSSAQPATEMCTARGQLGPLPNPVDEATASGCKSLPAWTRASRTWGEGPYGAYSTHHHTPQ